MSHAENMPFRMAHVIRRGIFLKAGQKQNACLLVYHGFWRPGIIGCGVRDKGDLKNGRNTAMMQNGMFEKVNNVTGDRRCGSLRESI